MTHSQKEIISKIEELLATLDMNEEAMGFITPDGQCFDSDLIEMSLSVVENLYQMELEF